MLGILESFHPKVTRCHVTKKNKSAIARQGSDLKNVPLHQFLRVPRCAVLPNTHLSTMGGSCLAHKLVVKLVVFPMMMAGSKELKCASEAMEQIKVHRARFQEALMWPPQKRLRTVPRGSTYQANSARPY